MVFGAFELTGFGLIQQSYAAATRVSAAMRWSGAWVLNHSGWCAIAEVLLRRRIRLRVRR